MPNTKIRVGLIGANVNNSWGVRAHIPALQALPEYELVAVCTAHRETAEESAKVYSIPMAFDDYRAMVQTPEIDLVTVSVRVPFHREMVLAALGASKSVFCEWPLGADLAEAQELTTLAKSSGLRHMVGLQARTDPALLYLKEMLAEGYVGEVLSVNMSMVNSGILVRGKIGYGWSADRKAGANTLTIAGGHSLDVMSFCIAEFQELSARVTTTVPTWESSEPGQTINVTSPDNIMVHGVLTNGAVASAHVALVPWLESAWKMEIYGREGTVVATTAHQVQFGQVRLRGGRDTDSRLEDIQVPDRFAWVPKEVPEGQPFNVAQMYRRLAGALQEDTGADPDFEVAVKRHHLLDVIEKSSDQQRKLPVSH